MLVSEIRLSIVFENIVLKPLKNKNIFLQIHSIQKFESKPLLNNEIAL